MCCHRLQFINLESYKEFHLKNGASDRNRNGAYSLATSRSATRPQKHLERVIGTAPISAAWKAAIILLYYTRVRIGADKGNRTHCRRIGSAK